MAVRGSAGSWCLGWAIPVVLLAGRTMPVATLVPSPLRAPVLPPRPSARPSAAASALRMAAADRYRLVVPEHLAFRADARIEHSDCWPVGVGATHGDSWRSEVIELRKHYDGPRFSATGQWVSVSEGRARSFSRASGSADGHEVWTVLEAGALGRDPDSGPRPVDGHMEERLVRDRRPTGVRRCSPVHFCMIRHARNAWRIVFGQW